MEPEEQEVWKSIQAMNRCWTANDSGKLQRLGDFFHETMVAITPVDRLRIEGKEACKTGWSQFANTTKILFWQEIDPCIQLYEDVAVVTYYYTMAYILHEQEITASGRDMMTLVRENGRWQIVADQFSPYPA